MVRRVRLTSRLYPAASIRRRAKCALTTTAVLGTALGATAAAAVPHTQLSTYTPFTPSGAPAVHVLVRVRGHCWTGSLAATRDDAWRCMTGNNIYDPCFSSRRASGVVLCPAAGPWRSAAVEIRLTQRLPSKYANRRRPSTVGLPWALLTTRGWKCRLATGATTVVGGRRANYTCTGTKDWLWGVPSRRTQPWAIYAAPASATKLTRRIAIKAAWF